jgi:catechol 2,3-dioxygenase-like lactoylglutathione lyase family enzyme
MNKDDPTVALRTRLHHLGSVVRDQERNRAFMEDVLGFPLVATWAERSFIRELSQERSFCHTFFEMEDGSALAFFQFADDDLYELCQPKVGSEISRFNHVSIRVGPERYDDLRSRLTARSLLTREIDHGYCKSLYTRSPDGLEMEFTLDPEDLDAIRRDKRASAREDLAKWLAGDHAPNNRIRPEHKPEQSSK